MGVPQPRGMWMAGPLLPLYLHIWVPLSPGRQETNHCHLRRHVASSAQRFGDINSWLKGENVNTLLGVIVLLAFEKQPPSPPWGQRGTVFIPVCGMSGSRGRIAVPSAAAEAKGISSELRGRA